MSTRPSDLRLENRIVSTAHGLHHWAVELDLRHSLIKSRVNVSSQGASVMVLSLTSVEVLAFFVLIELSKLMFASNKFNDDLRYVFENTEATLEAISG